ncbi:CD9 antigen [Nilaparvata lugens]|uniref:CD9 antigen n=1 Tax=Nilaparvata lugens TaxID=108931 RepID=UPI000B997769|nr:CD9 antigen [Nilaparvata lugens]
MGLSGCYACLKYVVFFINLIFWITGFTIIVLSLWMLIDPKFYVSMAQDESSYYSGVYLFLVVGILMFIVGFLGCCGTIRESQCMLVLFFCVLLIILVAEVSAAAWMFSNSDELEKLVKENVDVTVHQEYGVVPSRTETFDTIQQGLYCCGAKGPTDWLNSKYNNLGQHGVDLSISSPPLTYKIPLSCCAGDPQSPACQAATKATIAARLPEIIYQDGCSDRLVEKLRDYVSTFVVIGIIIAGCQILGLAFSLIVCCGIQQRNRYKA